MFHSYFERKYDNVWIFNVVHLANFEISAASDSFKIYGIQNLRVFVSFIC